MSLPETERRPDCAGQPNNTGEAAPSPCDAELRRRVTALLDAKNGIDETRAKCLRKEWEARLKAPGRGEGAPDESLAALFEQLRARVHAQVAGREQRFARVAGKLRQLRDCMENGDIKRAGQLERAVTDGLGQISGLSDERRRTIIAGLDEVRPRLRELSAWRKWGTEQARDKLIEEIRNLHQSGASLEQIARRIQRAREEWRLWDKAGEGGDKKRYAVFNLECTRAYEPCQAHFDRQKRRQQDNSEAREKICAALEEEFERVDWRDPDWKTLQKLVRQRTLEWRTAGAPSHRSRKPLQRRFDAALEKFDERLQRERERNYKIREKLAAEAALLAQREDIDAALAELQALKKSWVPTVTSSRRKEQALWKRFTEACEQVHAKRTRSRKEFTRTLKQNLKDRQTLCAHIETACGGGPEAHTELRANLGRWKQQWAQLGEAPKASAAEIDARYRNAIEQAHKALDRADEDAQRRRLGMLREKSLLCAEIEALALDGGKNHTGDARRSRLAELAARWEALPALPDEWENPIAARRQLASQAVADEAARKQLNDSLAANLETLHELLLRLEILAEVDSPEEFSRRRMALQIERLSAAMGKAGADAGLTAAQLIRDILLVGAVEPGRHTAAFERFERCLAKAERIGEA